MRYEAQSIGQAEDRAMDGLSLVMRLRRLSKWLRQQTQQYWKDIYELRCQEFMRASKCNDTYTAHRIARMLAQTQRGGRTLVVGRHRVPGSAAEWNDKVMKPGPEGGCSAEVCTHQEMVQQRDRAVKERR